MVVMLAGCASAHGATSLGGNPAATTADALRAANPDMISGGLYSAIEHALEPIPPATTAPLRAGMVDAAKGTPRAALDARVGENIRLGDDPSALPEGQLGQAEPHLSRSPADPRLLVAAFQEGRYRDAGAIDCGYAVSRDGGFSWTRALIPGLTSASGGPYNRATDPVTAAGPGGELYLNTLGSVSGTFARAAVLVSRSTDGGASWANPTVVYQSPNSRVSPDKNWIAVNDHPGTASSGRVVVTWTNFTTDAAGASTGNHLVGAWSDDLGATWSEPVALTSAGSLNQGTQPLFLPGGELAVVYVRFASATNTEQFSIECKVSADGGRSFPDPARVVVPSVAGWNDPDLREGVFLPSAAAARATGAAFVAFTALVDGTPRILVTRSSDSLTTWTAPVRASDNPSGSSVVNPAVAVSPDGMTVSVVYMQKRTAAGIPLLDIHAALSFDGGKTWQPSLRLSDVTSDVRDGPLTTRGYMFGDYIGIVPAAGGEPAVAIWCDARTGDSDPFTVRLASVAANTGADAFSAWAVVRGVSADPWSDPDADQDPNYLEYLQATDPRAGDTGDTLVMRRTSPTELEVGWAERATVRRLGVQDGVSVQSWADYASRGFSGSAVVGPSSTGTPPGVVLREGMAWRSATVSVARGEPLVAARSVSADLGVVASGSVASVSTDARMINVATRGIVGTGANQMIAGFVIDGPKTMLLRAAGPGLAPLGVSGVLQEPELSLTRAPASGGVLAANARWSDSSASAALFGRLGAFPFDPGSEDAALVQLLTSGGYTALVSGAGGSTGAALVEAYDADPVPGSPTGPRITNLSTRGHVGSASAEGLIAGFVINGTMPRRVLIRAVGPSLALLDVPGVLVDPMLTLYRSESGGGSTVLASVDDWQRTRSVSAIAATAVRLGAFALSGSSLDAALLTTLAPGAYTVVVSGVGGSEGVALVEVYDAD